MKTTASSTNARSIGEKPLMADNDEIEFRAGRRAATHTDIKDWVPLAGVSKMAVLLYVYLRMHVNRKRGDRKVKATMHTLAKLMGYSRGDKISGFLAELVAVKAVEAKRIGLTGRYVFTVHEEPPRGYTGPLGLPDWYDENRGDLSAERAAAKAARDARREAQRAKKTQVNPPLVSGQQGSVTPDRGELVAPGSGQPVTPDSGREPDVAELDGFEPDELNPPLPPLHANRSPARSDGSKQGGGESSKDQNPPDQARRLVDEIAPILAVRGEAWKYLDQRVRATLDDLEGKGHPFEVIRIALLHLANGTYGPTSSPKRVLEMGGWWDQAYAEYRKSSAGYAPSQRIPSDCQGCAGGGWLLEPDRGPGKRRLPVEPAVRCTHEAAMVSA